MTDLVSGREDLSDVNLIVFVGGFSNSDVLGSAKGWAGAFLYNPKAKEALDKFYKRKDTLSLGVCNGCQLVMELGLLYPEWKDHPKMHHNGSGRFESTFINLTIPENESVMLKSMAGSRLGAWVAHGEGRFQLPEERSQYRIAAQYSFH
jgi:phosphoribosylformylglycinamidine synthase